MKQEAEVAQTPEEEVVKYWPSWHPKHVDFQDWLPPKAPDNSVLKAAYDTKKAGMAAPSGSE